MTLPLIGDVVFWHWLALGFILLVIEMLMPGFFFLFLGAAAGAMGVVLLVMPDMGWQSQLILFSVLTVVSISAWRIWVKRNPKETEEPTLNQRGVQYVGRTFVLEQDMPLGRGKIHVDDTTWRAVCDHGDDLPSGSRVRVVDVDGTTLKVEPA